MSLNPLQQLAEHGQSVWLDYISRDLVTHGQLADLVQTSNVTGLTSNPTIFEKAIADSADYDDQIATRLAAGAANLDDLFYDLAISDIQRACDTLRTVWDRTDGADGFASLEVSPSIGNDTEATVRMVHRLWKAVDRPNLMVKIPATPAGIPAIKRCLVDGININVTLIFALSAYQSVIDAYISALEARLAIGHSLAIQSVASFFVSRVDTAVDPILKRRGNTELQGKAAIANAVLAYELFEKTFIHGERFARLRNAGAHVQRPLWASTSAKNPAYRDVVYAEALIGPHTVDTMPPATVEAFRDHGIADADTINRDYAGAHEVMHQLAKAGVEMDEVTSMLLAEGVASFGKSYDQLIAALGTKVSHMQGDLAARQSVTVGGEASEALTAAMAADTAAVRRIWERDPNLWKPDDRAHAAVISNRLGWLDVVTHMRHEVPRLEQLARDVVKEKYRDVVVLGMGGSSLCPEVLRASFGPQSGRPTLHVLDTTDPAATRALEQRLDLARTLFIVASKSGTTIETLSHFAHFHAALSAAGIQRPGQSFIAITDAGSALATLAGQHGFRDIFVNPDDIGGRYSALSFFGLVPAACVGIDVAELLVRAARMRAHCAAGMLPELNCGLLLGTAMHHFQQVGRDKLTILASEPIARFGLWAEQLIAESTGKDGTGIVPVALEPIGEASHYGNDRVFVVLRLGDDKALDAMVAPLRTGDNPVLTFQLDDAYDLGGEFFRWEFATALAGAAMTIDPFDEPNVQESKDNTRAVLTEYVKSGTLPREDAVAEDEPITSYGHTLDDLLNTVATGDYVAIMAYLPPDDATDSALQQMRVAIRDTYRVATTVGFGPRFLHSTGQLHKGGPPTGVYVQITADCLDEMPIPSQTYGFGVLEAAQAAGDLASLRNHQRRVARFHLGADIHAALGRLTDNVRNAAGARQS